MSDGMNSAEVLAELTEDERITWRDANFSPSLATAAAKWGVTVLLRRLALSRREAREYQHAAADLRHALEEIDAACEVGACLLCYPPDGKRHAPDCTVAQALSVDAGQRASWGADATAVRCEALERETREAAAVERERIAAEMLEHATVLRERRGMHTNGPQDTCRHQIADAFGNYARNVLRARGQS